MKGKVYLVGAGPGDKGLLTVKGKALIEKADVIVYDRLVSADIMDMIPENAELIDVGKNAGDHPVPQSKINEILAENAEEGKMTVRLKGGDPFVFGRGGEELELLKKKGIPFEVVPGITSSIAAPAYAGIPVTHRDYCSSLHIITGHAREGESVKIDFNALKALNGTLVFMMSVGSIPMISKGLLDAGMPEDTPCAVIENGTRTYQRKFISSLSEIAESVKINKVKSPSVILVGKVAGLSDDFDWFSTLPLKGRKIIVTQPVSKHSRLAESLEACGADVTLYPCVTTEIIKDIDPPFADFDVITFTSTVGVKSFFEYLLRTDRDSRCLYDKKISVIGTATEKELTKYGIKADFVPNVYSGRALAEEMIKSGFIKDTDKVLLLRTDKGSEDITEVLNEKGIAYLDYPVYRTELIKNEALDDISGYELFTFTSKSSVDGFALSCGKDDFTGLKALCIGEMTLKAAQSYGFDCTMSDKATIDSMVEKAVEFFDAQIGE